MLVKHKKWLKKSCSVVFFVFVCLFGVMYARHDNTVQSVLFQNKTVKKEIARGIGISGRAVTGVARIVRTVADCDEVQSGDIIVATMTNDEWLGAMKHCAGIITNAGGSQCHAALFGKQHDVPVIIGTGNATEKIKNGDVVTLDCSENSIGRVYSATYNDLPCQQTAIVHHNASAVIAYQQGGSCNSVREHKNTHQSYSCQHDMQSQCQQDAQAVHYESRHLYITQEVFNKHSPKFIANVVSTKNKYWWGKKTGTIEIGARAQGCDDLSVKCISVADDFLLNLSVAEIRSIINELSARYLHYINTLVEKCSSKPGDMNYISRVSHEEHIRTITLPVEVNKEELIKDPTKYKKIIDQKKVDMKERHLLIAAGLFARYWFENKCKA